MTEPTYCLRYGKERYGLFVHVNNNRFQLLEFSPSLKDLAKSIVSATYKDKNNDNPYANISCSRPASMGNFIICGKLGIQGRATEPTYHARIRNLSQKEEDKLANIIFKEQERLFKESRFGPK